MDRIRSIGLAIGFAGLLGAPTLAQPVPPGPPSGTATVNPRPTTTNPTAPSGLLQKVQNDWRGRTLLGSAVFNDKGQRIATINDLLTTDDGRLNRVILSVGRVRGKFVAVPFSQLQFVPSSGIGVPGFVTATDGAAIPPLSSSDLKTYGAVLPGATTDSLAKMEAFRFAP